MTDKTKETKKDKSVATTLAAYYRNQNEKMPNMLKILMFNYNIHKKSYEDLKVQIALASGDKDKDKGDIDGDDKDEKEVIKFILDPDNAYVLGKFGHSSLVTPSHRRIVINGYVINEGNISLKLN